MCPKTSNDGATTKLRLGRESDPFCALCQVHEYYFAEYD